ncbi:bifunctional phosphoribosylaminoimidazolecarboxamide formyltransferase/IMP cyclohydrolase [bacterium]|nr:bifunctional phosphoribosylaminoimidazolecarboxamide formyltransferase/IMP cyclohydrolase [bacterium]
MRAAAKNHARVLVLTDPSQYAAAIAAYAGDGPTREFREACARAAFARTAAYDGAIAGWLAKEAGQPADPLFAGNSPRPLRYGENPHQAGWVYAREGAGLGGLVQHQGKELSYNNWLDLDAAWRLLVGLGEPGATVVKHGNPTGLAVGEDALTALAAAWEGDPRAAFGSVVGIRPTLTAEAAEFLGKKFVEVVLAPEVAPEALEILARKRSLRVVSAPLSPGAGWSARTLSGVTLLQESDRAQPDPREWEWHGGRPEAETMADLRLALVAAKEMRSNAISLVRGGVLVGAGPGSTSRVGALEVALAMAGERARGAALASDAFFPFRDSVDLAAKHGIAAIVQPGGSIRDEEVLAAAKERSIAMALTGKRHFNH